MTAPEITDQCAVCGGAILGFGRHTTIYVDAAFEADDGHLVYAPADEVILHTACDTEYLQPAIDRTTGDWQDAVAKARKEFRS